MIIFHLYILWRQKTLFPKEVKENFHYVKFLARPGIEPANLSMNTLAFSGIWAILAL